MNLKAIKNFVLSLSRMIIMTLFFVVGAVIIQVIINGRGVSPDSVYDAIVAGVVAGVSVWVIIATIKLVVGLSRNNRLEKYLTKKGYCDEFYNRIKKKLDTKNEKKLFKTKLFYAKQLCDGERFEEAVEVMGSIDAKTVDVKKLDKYYSYYFYVLVFSQKLSEAEEMLEMADEYISQTNIGVLAKGVYQYAKEDYTEAEDSLLDVGFFASRHTKETAKMFLALCYLKCQKKNRAKKIVCELICEVTNPVLKDNLFKLMRLVEVAFSVADEENTENSQETAENTDNNEENIEVTDEEENIQDAGSID